MANLRTLYIIVGLVFLIMIGMVGAFLLTCRLKAQKIREKERREDSDIDSEYVISE